MDNLKAIVEREIRAYAGQGINGEMYFTHSDDGAVMSLVFTGVVRGKTVSGTSILARVLDDSVVVLEDRTNKPLVDALVQAGVPRERIVLAYAGEAVETA
jgi:hypothetical protein